MLLLAVDLSEIILKEPKTHVRLIRFYNQLISKVTTVTSCLHWHWAFFLFQTTKAATFHLSETWHPFENTCWQIALWMTHPDPLQCLVSLWSLLFFPKKNSKALRFSELALKVTSRSVKAPGSAASSSHYSEQPSIFYFNTTKQMISFRTDATLHIWKHIRIDFKAVTDSKAILLLDYDPSQFCCWE